MNQHYTPHPATVAARKYCKCETNRLAFQQGFLAACNQEPRTNPWLSGPLKAWFDGFDKGKLHTSTQGV